MQGKYYIKQNVLVKLTINFKSWKLFSSFFVLRLVVEILQNFSFCQSYFMTLEHKNRNSFTKNKRAKAVVNILIKKKTFRLTQVIVNIDNLLHTIS